MTAEELIQCGDALSELSLANFAFICISEECLPQRSYEDIMGHWYSEHVVSVCRYYLSTERLIDCLLKKALEKTGLFPETLYSDNMELFPPEYEDLLTIESAEEEHAFVNIVSERFSWMKGLLERYGVSLSECTFLELTGGQEGFVSSYVSVMDMSTAYQRILEENEGENTDFDDQFVLYRLEIAVIHSKALRMELLERIKTDLSKGTFDVDLCVNEEITELIFIAPASYCISGDSYPVPEWQIVDECGQAVTAASFMYLLAALSESGIEERKNI